VALLFDEKLVAIENVLTESGIPHAFGGANALAYYAPPRATADIDLNVFVPAAQTAQAARVLSVLASIGVSAGQAGQVEVIDRDGQVRVFWERTPIDVFFSYDALHDSSMERRRSVDFGGEQIHILSGEDLIVYKAVFDREKDWRDIAEMLYACDEPFDFDYVRGWLRRILPERDPRFDRLERLIDSDGANLG